MDELLALDNEGFEHKAYVSVLNRLLDEIGLANYQAKLDSGAIKIRNPGGLMSSREAVTVFPV